MSDEPTPETDAEQFPAEETKGKNFYFVAANFARSLERERDELRAEVDRLKAELETARSHSRVAYSEVGMRTKERDAAEHEVERLKTDKTRLFKFLGEYISIEAVEYDESAMRDIRAWVVRSEELELILCEHSVADDLSKTIDAAMKGELK